LDTRVVLLSDEKGKLISQIRFACGKIWANTFYNPVWWQCKYEFKKSK